jgi:hypothetical protein
MKKKKATLEERDEKTEGGAASRNAWTWG